MDRKPINRTTEDSKIAQLGPDLKKKSRGTRKAVWKEKSFFRENVVLIAFGLLLTTSFVFLVWVLVSSSSEVAVTESSKPDNREQLEETDESLKASTFFPAFIQANFGPQGPDRLNTIRFSGRIDQTGEGLDFLIFKKSPNMARMTWIMPNGVEVTFGVRGPKVWQHLEAPNGEQMTTELEDAEARRIRSLGVFFTPFVSYALNYGLIDPNFSILEEAGEAENLIQIEFTNPHDRMLSRVWVDAESLLVQSREDPDRESGDIRVVFSDYESIDGFRIPKTIESYLNDELTQTIEIGKITLNEGILSDFFEMPPDAE
jgi:hypothetical protein